MSKIISVSRRTDVPAFYGEWFMNRIKEAFAGYVNPFSGKKYFVSLKPEDVACFVFWSKNFAPFMKKLALIEERGYRFYFNYTITGLPDIFESLVPDRDRTVDTLKRMSDRYSPKHINWRYDPIIISDITGYDVQLRNFEALASGLKGYVERCYFSYVMWYGKVRKSFDAFQKKRKINILEPGLKQKLNLLRQLSGIAGEYGITMYSCCGDALLSSRVRKAHCVDGNIINDLFHNGELQFKQKPTRKECGCSESYDIGAYDTCPHGCLYCYANVNKEMANNSFKNHKVNSVFL